MELDVDPEKDFHVVLNGVATALSLDALDAAYQADSISDETLIWQEGMDEWMRLDALLSALGGQEETLHAPGPPVDEETYFVMVAPEEIKKMSLDLLADAYRLDVISENTLVWQPGYAEWVPLSVLLGGSEPEQHVSIAPSLAPTQNTAPVSMSQAPHSSASGFASAPVSVAPVSVVSGISAPNSLVPTTASIAPHSQGAGFAHNTTLVPLDLPLPVAAPASPWFKRSLVALGALSAVFILYRQGMTPGGESAESALGAPGSNTVQGLDRWLDGVAVENGLSDLSATEALPSNAGNSDVTAEPSDSAEPTEKELMEKARLADEAAAKETKKAGSSSADSFGARLAGKSAAKKGAPARSKRKWRPKAKKASTSSGNKYDPMNGAL